MNNYRDNVGDSLSELYHPPAEHIKTEIVIFESGQDFKDYGKTGDIHYDTDLQKLMIFDGGKWLEVGVESGTIKRANFGGPVVRELDL